MPAVDEHRLDQKSRHTRAPLVARNDQLRNPHTIPLRGSEHHIPDDINVDRDQQPASPEIVLIRSAGQESDGPAGSPPKAVNSVEMFPPGPDNTHEPA
jgi:hypothetical protein